MHGGSLTRKGFLGGLAGGALGLPGRAAPGAPGTRRVAEVDLFPFLMEARQVIRIAFGSVTAAEILVRLRTEEGMVGWGEASPLAQVTGETQASALAAGKGLAPVLRGRDPFDVARIVDDLDAAATGNGSIKAAFEMALWDLCGKIAGQPVCHLLGQYRDSFETDCTVYLNTPQAMAERAQAIVSQGFRIVKVKVGEAPELDIERLRAVRQAVGARVRLRIDANQGWTPAAAVRALGGIEPFGVEFCEQPVVYSDWEGLKHVRDHSGIPIMADEAVHSPADAIEAVRRGAADMINIKLMKSGGILQAMRIAHIAEAANMKCMLGSMCETRAGLTAAAHLVASQKNIQYADLDTFTEHRTDPVTGGMRVKDGVVTLPDTPGLGFDFDGAFLKTLRAA